MTIEEMNQISDTCGVLLKFERIPEADRRHERPDLCAFIYLHEKLGAKVNGIGGKNDMIAAAEHDVIYLDYSGEDAERLTVEDFIYVNRCGVMYDEDNDCLHMFA